MSQLVKYEAACLALAEAKSTDEVKDIRDKAEALRSYARQAKNRQLEIDAAEIRMRAERRLGSMLAEQKATIGLAKGGHPYQSTGSEKEPVGVPTLADAGIDKKLSSRAQRIAAVQDDDFERMIGRWREALESENERVTTDLLRAAKKAERKEAVAQFAEYAGSRSVDLRAFARAGKRFGTIYADPPWLYDNQATRAATSNHYAGMTVEELCNLPVKDIIADDAHLHLWTTNAFLFECPKIFDAWGFEFRSSFVWCKPQMGIGNYWRCSHEILLTAIRGDAKRFNDKTLKSWIECDRGRHSAKPERVRDMIVRASPGPYLEMFARAPVTGWDVWGNEVDAGADLLTHSICEFSE